MGYRTPEGQVGPNLPGIGWTRRWVLGLVGRVGLGGKDCESGVGGRSQRGDGTPERRVDPLGPNPTVRKGSQV